MAASIDAMGDGSDSDGSADGAAVAPGTGGRDAGHEAVASHKAATHLLPLLAAATAACGVARLAPAWAAPSALHMTPAAYGTGAGAYLLGYALAQLPASLWPLHISTPAALAAALAVCGAATSACGLLVGTHAFAVLRLLGGAAEGVVLPGLHAALAPFFHGSQVPAQAAGPGLAAEASASAALLLAPTLGVTCLLLDGLGGVAGWQWVFTLGGGLPLLLAAAAVYRLLPSGPDAAAFLAPAERRALARSRAAAPSAKRGLAPRVGGGAGAGGGAVHADAAVLRLTLRNGWVWYMAVVHLLREAAWYGIVLWAPTTMHALLVELRHFERVIPFAEAGTVVVLGGTPDKTEPYAMKLLRRDGAFLLPAPDSRAGRTALLAALLAALFLAATVATSAALSRNAGAAKSRVLHVALLCAVAGAGLTMYPRAALRSAWRGAGVLGLGMVASYAGRASCRALLADVAAGPGAAGAAPMYRSIGALGGWLAPTLAGVLLQRSLCRAVEPPSGGWAAGMGGGFGAAAQLLGGALCIAGGMLLAVGILPGGAGHGGGAREHVAPSRQGGGGAVHEAESVEPEGHELRVAVGR